MSVTRTRYEDYFVKPLELISTNDIDMWTLAIFILYNCPPNSHQAVPWWRHQMETFFALLALCAGNSPVSGEFPAQRPVTRSFDVSFDLRLDKRLSKQSWGWWFETLSRSLCRHRNGEISVVWNIVLTVLCLYHVCYSVTRWNKMSMIYHC